MPTSSALILPSSYEAKPMVLLEAMASRHPDNCNKGYRHGTQSPGKQFLLNPLSKG